MESFLISQVGNPARIEACRQGQLTLDIFQESLEYFNGESEVEGSLLPAKTVTSFAHRVRIFLHLRVQ